MGSRLVIFSQFDLSFKQQPHYFFDLVSHKEKRDENSEFQSFSSSKCPPEVVSFFPALIGKSRNPIREIIFLKALMYRCALFLHKELLDRKKQYPNKYILHSCSLEPLHVDDDRVRDPEIVVRFCVLNYVDC